MKVLVVLFLLLVPSLAIAQSGWDCGVVGGRLACGVPGTGGCILICDGNNTNCSCTESGEQETDGMIGLRGTFVQRVSSPVLAAKIGSVATLEQVITACEQTPGCSYQVQPSGATGGFGRDRNFRIVPFSWGAVKVIYR